MFRPIGLGVAALAGVLTLAACTAAGPSMGGSASASVVQSAQSSPPLTPALPPTGTPALPSTGTPVPPPTGASTPPATGASTPPIGASTPPRTPNATSGFDRSAYSLDDPGSIWVVVDKQRPLQPKSWIPPDLVTPAVPHTNVPQLRRVAATALVTMFAAAKQDGITLVSLSAYRSYATQRSIFDRNTVSLGRATTLQLTAKPGFSEHQTGLADDLGDGTSCDLRVCFESHPAAKWLTRNAWKYGFIKRYPLGYTTITGIQTEPWHFRYVGRPVAQAMRSTGVQTLEQFFALPAAPNY